MLWGRLSWRRVFGLGCARSAKPGARRKGERERVKERERRGERMKERTAMIKNAPNRGDLYSNTVIMVARKRYATARQFQYTHLDGKKFTKH